MKTKLTIAFIIGWHLAALVSLGALRHNDPYARASHKYSGWRP